MGVGLSISRTIIEAHGGRIWTEPNPGGGAIFHFTLRTVNKEEVRNAG
jgi:two-component system sensor kinase FixL